MLILVIYVLLPSIHSNCLCYNRSPEKWPVPALKSLRLPEFWTYNDGTRFILKRNEVSIQKSHKWPIHLASFFLLIPKVHLKKKITQCSKIFEIFILESKWTVEGFSYTLSRDKSNGTIHFVLSLKLGEP